VEGEDFNDSGADDVAAEWIQLHLINPFPDAPGVYELAKSWIQECLTMHDHWKTGDSRFMPSTLIQISINSTGYHLQVAHWTLDQQPAPYTCLSYCWGQDQPYKMTRQRLEESNGLLQFDNLPKTIQDAVKVTTNLGYEYLWVDSICIVQDDEQDKLEQIPKMSLIYANAVVTIAAATSDNVFGGFLQERNVHDITSILPFEHPDGRVGAAGLANTTYKEQEKDFSPTPLDDRAWILQERLLASRTLEYRERQLRFFCPSAGNKPGYSDGGRDGPVHDGFSVRANLRSLPSSFPSHYDFLRTWFEIVEGYTHRKLSVPTDRILAISGVAAKFARIMNYDNMYVAGHWKPGIIHSLLWHCAYGDRHPSKARNLPYQAPTWSWTSLNGAIIYSWSLDRRFSESNWLKLDSEAELVNAEYELQDQKAPFGAANMARLTIKGQIKRVQRIRTTADSIVEFAENPDSFEFYLFEDTEESGRLLNKTPLDTSIYLLLLTRATYIQQDHDYRYPAQRVFGLVLREVDEKGEMMSFERLGWWRFYWPRALWGKDWKSKRSEVGSSRKKLDGLVRNAIDKIGFEMSNIHLV
jgi:hypothetical protein